MDKFYLRPGEKVVTDDVSGVAQWPVGKVFQDTLRSGGQGPQMVVLPTGSYRRVDLSGEGYDDQQPVRKVTISHSLAMMTHEVTFADYDRYVRVTPERCPEDYDEWGRGTRPVDDVSWEDAQGYAHWLSEQTGKRYRLPSEAEWEYAARAGTPTEYSWGNEASHSYANYGAERCCDGLVKGKDRWEYSAPVGNFAPNDWGLYDMHGNVFEWVADCYDDSYESAPVDGSAKVVCDEEDLERSLRGGSRYVEPARLRSAYRTYIRPGYRGTDYGFRLVQDLSP